MSSKKFGGLHLDKNYSLFTLTLRVKHIEYLFRLKKYAHNTFAIGKYVLERVF